MMATATIVLQTQKGNENEMSKLSTTAAKGRAASAVLHMKRGPFEVYLRYPGLKSYEEARTIILLLFQALSSSPNEGRKQNTVVRRLELCELHIR